MKKLRNLLFVFAVMAVMLVPMGANALEYDFKASENTCKTPDKDGYCTTEGYFTIKLSNSTENISSFSGMIALKDASSANGIKDFTVTGLNGFKAVANGDASKGWGITVTNESGKLSATEHTQVFKVSFKHLATVNCSLIFTDGKTEIEVTVETEIEESPKTGISLPYVALGCVAVGAIAVYGVSSKKTKIRKI